MASAVIGALRVNLGIDSAQFQDGLKKAQQSLAGIGKSMMRVGAGLSAAVTAPLVAFGVDVARVAGEFEAAMNRVGAATGATGDELASMSTLARTLGKETSKSASEAADMMEMLAKNGLSAEQILGGAAKSAIALSEATGGDLARSADVATNVMAQFNLKVADLPRIVDQITASTLDSQFGFDDYALALGQAGGVAGGLGVTLEDFNTVITATADTFNSGSDAGTSFKTFLLSLSPTSDKAAAAIEELGLQFYNANGSMKSMAEIAEELRTGMGGLSDEALNMNMHQIFGTDAMRTAIALMNQGADGLNKVQEGINRQGVAAEQQAARMKGLNGELEKLSGAFTELKLAIADSGLLQTLTQLITKVAEWVTQLAATSPEIFKWGTVVAGLAAIMGPVVLAVGALVIGIGALATPIGLAVAGITAVGAAIAIFWPQIQALAAQLTAFVSGAWAQFVAAWDGMVAKVQEVDAAIQEFANSIPAIFAGLAEKMYEIGVNIMQGLWNGIKSMFASIRDSVVNFAGDMVNSIKSTLGMQSPSKVMHDVGVNVMQGLGNGMESMKDGVTSIADNIVQSITSAFQGVIEGTKSVKEAIADVLKSLAKMLLDQGFKMLFSGLGGGGGGIGGALSGIFGKLFGFAQGGSFKVGGSGGVDSQLVAFKASPNEHVTVNKPGNDNVRGGTADVRVWVDENGNWQAKVESISQRTATHVTRAGIGQYDEQLNSTIGGKVANAQARQM